MKHTLLLLICCSVLVSNLMAQQNKACSCLQLFAEDLEKIDTNAVTELHDHISNRFQQLKVDNPQFSTCVDFYSLAYNMWTIGKLRIMLQASGCSISEKAKAMLEEGPLIYEMNFKLEKQIKTQHEATQYEQFKDEAIISDVLANSVTFVKAAYTGKAEDYLNFLPNWFIDFYGKEEILQTQTKAGKQLDSLNFQVNLKAPKPVNYFLQKEQLLMSLIAIEAAFKTNERTIDQSVKLLAISEDLGESWNYIDISRSKLNSFWALNRAIDPIALEDKFNSEGSSKYAAKNGTELGTHFCECAKDVDQKDFMKLMACSKILIKHPLWKNLTAKKETYRYVKENCAQHKKALVFMGLDKLEQNEH